MSTVGVSQAKARLSLLIDEVNSGVEVTITRHGEPVARLVAAHPAGEIDRSALIVEIKNLRRTLRIPRVNLRESIDEGRDYPPHPHDPDDHTPRRPRHRRAP